ncbi:DUF255-domain-containing protein [Rhizopus microsporus ATCC 52813]|uniref:DUF255-domain-containing protein n=1 Tax=Rhizopus microsporus ATCC 52813 TaxID=1340429 RepID=A0A2G4T8J7_RHIZD|nr:DUF255-domain-containing protein [Rhizopus microsporus ATCC 52813]PHZ17329.1 DUF255-domain-containing protein [Rhizopus microsporus ATCC 52813]
MSDNKHKYTNRLINEKSPYLLQHAHNPVDWYPWGNEAFELAKKENKPIFLSIGYSTCHWCHVMEHESFEDEKVAEIMNEYYVNIKVDREENPGVDRLYMTFVQLTTGHGGWPMSIFLTPELTPFFGGSYFPPQDRYGSPGFKTLLTRIARMWAANPNEIRSSGKNIIGQLQDYAATLPATEDGINFMEILEDTYDHFENSFDAIDGGFGKAPKFPTPVQLKFLMDYYHLIQRSSSESASKAIDMVTFTLKKIASGGIHDHVGSGFHRYSTDKKWHVPHFEKMLYDQAQLLSLYSFAYLITKESIFADVANDIILYVSRDLRHPDGGFYSAEDADSYPNEEATKKLEGAFCVWESAELEGLLGAEVARVYSVHYGVKKNGNVSPSQDPHKELTNKNVLMETGSLADTAKAVGKSEEDVRDIIKTANAKLWKHRSQVRPKPHRDEKILVTWNGMMISGLIHAYQAIKNENALSLAISAAEFIYKNLYNASSHTLIRSFCEGASDIGGVIDDYSNLIQSLLDLYEATLDEKWVEWAAHLQEKQNELFFDDANGGFFNVTTSDTSILIRMKDDQDGAEPSANAVALKNLARLSFFLGNDEYMKKAQATVQAFQVPLTKYPFALPAFVSSFILVAHGSKEIVLAGRFDEKLQEFIQTANDIYLPNRILIYAKPDGFIARKNAVVGEIASKGVQEPTAYICKDFSCGLPIYSPEEFKTSIKD